eukprot:scaffold10278_cov113-Skeletonema_dohrnii-CCMP3373.AAC.7
MYEEDRYDARSRRPPIYEDDCPDDRAPRRGSAVGEFGGHERHRKRYAEDRNDRFYEEDRFYEGEERFGRNMKYVDRSTAAKRRGLIRVMMKVTSMHQIISHVHQGKET